MSEKFDLSDYVDVAERLDLFFAKYPEGSLQSEITERSDKLVTVTAYAYRTPEDPRPGMGRSSLAVPGSTPYTRGSELENAETSAWGRAIRATGIKDKKGKHVASRDEVRSKQPPVSQPGRGGEDVPGDRVPASPGGPAPVPQRTEEEEILLSELIALPGMTKARMTLLADAVHIPKGQHATAAQLRAMIDFAQASSEGPITQPEAAPESVSEPVDDPGRSSSGASGVVSEPGGSPPAASAPAPTMDDILAVTGGTDITPPWPRPGSDAYKRLSAYERSTARGWWQKHGESEVPVAPA